MSNFTFLQNEQSSLFNKMKRAEERVNTEPVSSANYCRLVLEESIRIICDLEYIELPFNKELYNLMANEEIKNLIPYRLINGSLSKNHCRFQNYVQI